MSDENLLDLPGDIDRQITELCRDNENLTTEDVLRDLARISCVVHLVKQGEMDGQKMVLAGGMAMRCLSSPRMSIYDADASCAAKPDENVLESAISLDNDEFVIQARRGPPGRNLSRFKPIDFEAQFSDLDGSTGDFAFEVSYRGLELEAVWESLNPGYPFNVLPNDFQVPVMNPMEILAEKTVAWLLFGNAKHYNDIAFLSAFQKENLTTTGGAGQLRGVVRKKLAVNRDVSQDHQQRVESLDDQIVLDRLENPQNFVDPEHAFEGLAYLTGQVPQVDRTSKLVGAFLVPALCGHGVF